METKKMNAYEAPEVEIYEVEAEQIMSDSSNTEDWDKVPF